jgi:glycosyltransferase involved in cell wall biosynthesis
VDIERFVRTRSWPPQYRAELRRRWGLPEDRAIILSLGALERRKRHALTISALRPALSAKRAVLVVVGEGPERGDLVRLARDWQVGDTVRLTGYVQATEELLAVADVLVQASAVEGVPQVVIQALAAGVPVVATDVEGLREVPAAQVQIVHRSGEGLLSAVERSLEERAAPVDPTVLQPWSLPAVERQVSELHDRIERRLGSHFTTWANRPSEPSRHGARGGNR